MQHWPILHRKNPSQFLTGGLADESLFYISKTMQASIYFLVYCFTRVKFLGTNHCIRKLIDKRKDMNQVSNQYCMERLIIENVKF
jgi:hypothetical protein